MLSSVSPASEAPNLGVVLGTLTHKTINQLEVTIVYILFPCATSSGNREEEEKEKNQERTNSVILVNYLIDLHIHTCKQQTWLLKSCS